MPYENEVRHGIREFEAECPQLLFKAFSCTDNLLRCLVEIRVVLYRSRTKKDRRQIHRIGIKRKLHVFQAADQLFLTKCKSDPHAGHRP